MTEVRVNFIIAFKYKYVFINVEIIGDLRVVMPMAAERTMEVYVM